MRHSVAPRRARNRRDRAQWHDPATGPHQGNRRQILRSAQLSRVNPDNDIAGSASLEYLTDGRAERSRLHRIQRIGRRDTAEGEGIGVQLHDHFRRHGGRARCDVGHARDRAHDIRYACRNRIEGIEIGAKHLYHQRRGCTRECLLDPLREIRNDGEADAGDRRQTSTQILAHRSPGLIGAAACLRDQVDLELAVMRPIGVLSQFRAARALRD